MGKQIVIPNVDVTFGRPELRGLTLRQPWSWAVAHGWEDHHRPPQADLAAFELSEPKRIENRQHALTLAPVLVAIHAGKTVEGGPVLSLRIAGFRVPESLAHGVIEAVAVLSGRVYRSRQEVPASQRFWWTGPVAHELLGVQILLNPVPARGLQGLWPVPEEVAAQVFAQIDVEALREHLLGWLS